MLSLPTEFIALMIEFQGLFSKRVFLHATLMVAGAILAPGTRTVASVLRIMGLSHEHRFHKYHRVLSHARWSAREAACLLLRLLLHRLAPTGPLIFGLDDTLERRWGKKIKARGIYRDSVRSSKGHFVKASGLRWLSMMLLVEVPWAHRVWALPFLTVLTPSERYHQRQGRRHKKLTDYARQMILQLRRWLPDRVLIVVADSSFAALELLSAVSQHVGFITRLRLDAALYEPTAPRRPGQVGRPRKKGKRLPTLAQRVAAPQTQWQTVVLSQWYGHTDRTMELATGTCLWFHYGKPAVPIRWVLLRDPEDRLKPAALLSTNRALSAVEIVHYFVRRWSVEVTFEEVRAHLGVETQRQWSDRAIARSTPVLLGLFSLVTLLADGLKEQNKLTVRRAAWYPKTIPTFSDALACVRQHLWRSGYFLGSGPETEMVKIPRPLLHRLTQTLAYAA